MLVDGERIATSTVIWAAGVQTETLADVLGAERSRGGRVIVMPDLAVSGHPDVFVTGDMANAVAPDGRSHPRSRRSRSNPDSTPHAKSLRRINGHPTEPFVYRNRGTMATIGRRSAVTELPSGIRIRGTLGWLSWLFLHLLYLVGFRNRLSVLLNWGVELRDPRTGTKVDLRSGRAWRTECDDGHGPDGARRVMMRAWRATCPTR